MQKKSFDSSSASGHRRSPPSKRFAVAWLACPQRVSGLHQEDASLQSGELFPSPHPFKACGFKTNFIPPFFLHENIKVLQQAVAGEPVDVTDVLAY